jgi:TonB family protein
MNIRAKLVLPLFSLISVAVFGGDKDVAKYPVRVHFVDMQSATATTTNFAGFGATSFGPTKGSGHGNIEAAGSWRGIDYSFECAERPDVNTAYDARWKKPDIRLVIVMPEIGNPKKDKECELKTTVRDVVYGIDAGTKSLTSYSYEQFAKILAQRKALEEDSNPSDVDPAHFPASVTILEAQWQEVGVGAVAGTGRGTIQNGDAIEAFEFDGLCPSRLMTSLQGSGYPGRWVQEPTRIVILSHDMGLAERPRQCELNTSVHTDKAYIRNQNGAVVAIPTEQYKTLLNIPSKPSPDGQNSQENTVQIPDSMNPPRTPAPPMLPDQSSGTPSHGVPPTRIKQGGATTATSITSQVSPVYPPLAQQARIQGDVVLHVIITKDGNVEKIEVISGHPLLIQAAVDAVKQWRFKKAFLNGTPAEVDTTITVTFTLGDFPAPATQASQGPPSSALKMSATRAT